VSCKNYKEVTCTTALHHLKRRMPYSWDLNIYRGCEHGCKYCYAIYSHEYIGSGDYFGDIYVKTNIVDALEKQLREESWQREIINIGGVTDSYQPAEAQYCLMPEILKLLIRYKTPAIISTKSDLVLRDYELIDELSQLTYVNIAATTTTWDENLRQKLEPGGVSTQRRFAMLKQFRRTNASVGVHMMPIIPYMTDGYANLEALLAAAKDSEAHYVLPGTLYLRGKTRGVFFAFIKEEFPQVYEPLLALYKTGGAGKEYKDGLYKNINALREQYAISSSYVAPMRQKLK